MPEQSFVDRWISGPFEILFPRECLVCARPLRGFSLCFRCHPTGISLNAPRCGSCFEYLPTADGATCGACHSFPLQTNRIRYLWEYEGVARDFIRAMKYRPCPYLAKIAGECLALHLGRLFPDTSWDLVIPAPSSPEMLKKRLFHPCSEMTKALSQQVKGIRILHNLRHQGNRTPQARRSHRERLQGLKRIFHLTNSEQIRGTRVLLVEDVITTGATLAAAAYTLREAGVQSIDVLALAKARVWRRFRSNVFNLLDHRRSGVSGILV